MPKPVRISEIVEGMQLQSDESESYLNLETGEVVFIWDYDVRTVENGALDDMDDLPEWQQEQFELTRDVLDDDEKYIPLPTQYEINEYSIMEDFCYSISNRRIRDIMLDAIRGRGAFRRFKEHVDWYDIADDWYSYRDRAYKEIAVEWCKENEIEFIDDN